MTRGRYDHLLSFAIEHPWSVTRPMLGVIATILARRIAGTDVSRDEIEAAIANRKTLPQPKVGSVGVVPIYGVIAPRVNLLSDMSGGTSYETLSAQLRELVAKDDIKTIVLDVDSPGGSVAGASELAQEVLAARAKKPVVAVAEFTMASAAYHIASAATEIVAAPSARVGSIGTFAIHNDISAALAEMGIKRTFISAGVGKTAGNETEPLAPEAAARIQAAVDSAYATFVGDVVKGRGAGVTAKIVRDDWQAHVYTADEAKTLGMVDRVATLRQTLARLLGSSADAGDRQLAAQLPDDLSAPRDTDQEPARATSQDRARDDDRQRLDLALLDL